MLEKTRFHSGQDEKFLSEARNLEAKIELDPEAKTISIIDAGVSMNKVILIKNLGTMAKSGTMSFLEFMAESTEANLIGQSGVDFYFAFLVAGKASVTFTRNDDFTKHVGKPSADASFTVGGRPPWQPPSAAARA